MSHFRVLPAALLLFSVLRAATIPITRVGSTQTQIVINYTATSAAACAVTVSDNNGGTNPPRDVDPALFPNSNTDLGRSTANGFRWPTLVNGLNRTVYIGGHDEIKKAADNRWYSTALQVASDHTITVLCNSGADSGSIHVGTMNIPQGSNYPELPIPTPGSPLGGVPQPTIFWNDTTQNYIDPISGVLLKVLSRSLDNGGGIQGSPTLVKAFDLNGSWSNAANAITRQAPSTLATTSTPNAPLFLAWGNIAPYCCALEISDIQAALYGKGNTGSEIASVCISEDSGQTCASGSIDTTFNSTTGIQANVPSSFPSNYFSSWGLWNAAFGTYDITNQSFGNVSASGSTVTMASLSAAGFNQDRKPGSKFALTSCATGADTVLTFSTVDLPTQITTQESGLNLTNCTFTEYSSGLRVILKNSGTLNLSASIIDDWGNSDSSGSNGLRYVCAKTKVTDIAKDCDGVSQNPPLSGYMCEFSNGIYLVQDNGRMCLQANTYNGNQHLATMNNPWIDNKTLLRNDWQNPPHIWKLSLNNGGDYTSFQPNADHSTRDKFTYTDLTSGGTPLAAQVQNQGGTVANAVGTGLWPSFTAESACGGNTQYRSTAAGDASLCMMAWTDGNNNLIRTAASWDVYPLRWGGCHFVPTCAGGFSNAIAGSVPAKFNPSALLGGPFHTPVIAIRKNGTFQTHSMVVTAATAASPVVVTSPNHDLDNLSAVNSAAGAYVTCAGGTGAWTAINRSFYAHVIDNNTFSLYLDETSPTPFDGSSFGSLTGSVTCSTAPAMYNIRVTGVGNDGQGHARVTLDIGQSGYAHYFPDQRQMIQSGDPINFTNLNQYTQYYAKVGCSGCSASQVDVYKDAGLTVHASLAEITGADSNGGTVSYAETCPDPATITLPGPMYFDQGFGTAGNPKVRCVTIRVAGEPCSAWASTGEQAAYPCPSDPSNSHKSSLQNLAVGDAIFDLSHVNNNHEIMYVIAKNKSSESQMDLTLVRWYGNTADWRGADTQSASNSRTGDNYAYQHSFGWTGWAWPPVPSAWINYTAGRAWLPESPQYPGAHHDMSQGSSDGNLVLSAGYPSGVYDDIVDQPAATLLSTPASFKHNSLPIWGGDPEDSMASSQKQFYPNHRQIWGQAPGSEQVWKGDWMAANPDWGNAQNNADGLYQRTITKIRGTAYDSGNTTNLVYRATTAAPSGVVNIKVIPYMMHASPHYYFVDKSGPGSLITDADIGKYCVAFVAGECRPGSAAGDAFFAMRGFWDVGWCISNAATMTSPCFYALWPGAGWAVQVRQTPVDVSGTGVRRLTMGFNLPLTHFAFQNWISSPDAKWGFFAANPIQYRPQWQYYSGAHYFAMKLPPWPVADTVNRTTFVNLPIKFSGQPGDRLRIAFGYAENGDPTKFYCTTRNDACWTSSAATARNPFLFASETQSPTPCDSGCTVPIPAIPGRVVYYQVERSNGASVVSGPLQTVVAP